MERLLWSVSLLELDSELKFTKRIQKGSLASPSVWGPEPPHWSSDFGHPLCFTALHAPPGLRGLLWKGTPPLIYTICLVCFRRWKDMILAHAVCVYLLSWGRVGGPCLALVNWLHLRKDKGKAQHRGICLPVNCDRDTEKHFPVIISPGRTIHLPVHAASLFNSW